MDEVQVYPMDEVYAYDPVTCVRALEFRRLGLWVSPKIPDCAFAFRRGVQGNSRTHNVYTTHLCAHAISAYLTIDTTSIRFIWAESDSYLYGEFIDIGPVKDKVE